MGENTSYIPKIQALIRIWHKRKSSAEISKALGLKVSRGLDVGEFRDSNHQVQRKETYCSMVLLQKGLHNITDSIEHCAKFLETKRSFTDRITAENGEVWIIIQLFDCNYIDFSFDQNLISSLNALSVGVSFENHVS